MDPKNNTFKSIAREQFKFLEQEFGYEFQFRREPVYSFLDSVQVEYSNTFLKREIMISFSTNLRDGRIHHSVASGIAKIPYDSVEDYISIFEYLQRQEQEFSFAFFDGEDFEVSLSVILEKLARLFRKDLISVINGSDWYTQYYPRKD